MIANIDYKTFIVFMYFYVLYLLWVYFVLPELKGLTLEEIDAVFADEISAEGRLRRDRINIAVQLGVHSMANAAAEGVFVDERRDSISKQVIETAER